MDYVMDSAVRGYHIYIYQALWPNPYIGEQLECQEEYGNAHDMYAVSVIHEDAIVGHLPRNISTPCLHTLKYLRSTMTTHDYYC